jgi:S-DNA-T family DNA segregation ATPase FtsK/SpoIIIE
VINLIDVLVAIASVVWSVSLVAGPMLVLLALWRAGHKQGHVPRWVLPETERTAEAITPSIVVLALRDLGIAPLRKAIQAMADGAAGMLGPITLAGCGVEVDVTLPSGVSTDEIQARRRKLAENLGRHEHELHVTIPTAARTVRLWIADAGALDEKISPSPLVTDPTMTGNYKTGRAPWGVDLRGDQIAISLFQRHLLVTGLSNQGKTFSIRALALWLALDPTVELRLADLKGSGDWSMFGGIATVLIEGPTDDHVAQATEMLEEGVQEMNRRLTSPPGTTWAPLVLIVDEAQVAYMCPEKDANGLPYGGKSNLSRFLRAVRYIHNQGRKVDVLLWEGTQDPTDQNLPKLAREGAHIRAGLAVGTESQARMAIGDKAMDSKGASPHLLRQGLDKGTLVVAPGDAIPLPAGVVCTTVRTYFVDDGPAAEIAKRARELRSGVTTRSTVEPTVHVDPLADIAAVLGAEPRMVTQDVLRGLVALNADYYRPWTFATLTQYLAEFGAEPVKSNRMFVDRQRVLDALAARDADAEDTTDDDSE